MCEGNNTSTFSIELPIKLPCPKCSRTMTNKDVTITKDMTEILGKEIYCINKDCELYKLLYRANWPKVSLTQIGTI